MSVLVATEPCGCVVFARRIDWDTRPYIDALRYRQLDAGRLVHVTEAGRVAVPGCTHKRKTTTEGSA